jgi:hypothetical protein
MNGEPARIPIMACPTCGYRMDAATPVDGDATPSPGDYTLCIFCSETLVFEKDLKVHKITPEEERAMPDDVRINLFRAKLFIATTVDKSKLKGAP